ncbi:MAG: flavodoxin FldA [Cyanobacteria bacterium J06642_2]
MAKIGLFYGSTTGNTEAAAEAIQKEFGGDDVVQLHEVSSADGSDFGGYECIIIGCPTWNVGELQDDWDGYFEELDSIDFSGKKVAYFGTGDQVGYSDNFQDAMGILEAKISERGGTTVGFWPTAGYDHEGSRAERDGKFVGLALDEDNQSDQSEDRIKQWVQQLKQELGV